MKSLFSESDRAFMRRALALARRGLGCVEPNPMVGCVLVRQDRIVGEGYHRRWGGPHAEVEAIRAAGEASRGATAYVTLEPCSHTGKTPPCTRALIDAGVHDVIASHRDPFAEVSGRGFRTLRRAGIGVRTGLLCEEAAELNAPFLTRVARGRPYVIAKWAQSLDGKIATRTGDSKWITGPDARRIVHRLRARVDAVIVGIRTVLADDPMLDARDVPIRRTAVRVVFDSRLRLPVKSRLASTATRWPTLVVTCTDVYGRNVRRRQALERCGVDVLPCRRGRSGVSVRDVLRRLAGMGHTNVLVEGGGELIGSFQDASLIDEVQVFTAPLVIGGGASQTGCGGTGVAKLRDASRAMQIAHRRVGKDMLTTLRLSSIPNV